MDVKKRIKEGDTVKIIEINESGDLVFLEKNFNAILEHSKEYIEYKPVGFLSLLGGQTREKIYFSRLIEKRLEQGTEKWRECIKKQKNSKTSFFSRPPEQNCSEKSENGIYLWPSILQLSQNSNTTLVFVLHVYTNKENGRSSNKLLAFAKLISTGCVNLSSDDQASLSPAPATFTHQSEPSDQRDQKPFNSDNIFKVNVTDNLYDSKGNLIFSNLILDTAEQITIILLEQSEKNVKKAEYFKKLVTDVNETQNYTQGYVKEPDRTPHKPTLTNAATQTDTVLGTPKTSKTTPLDQPANSYFVTTIPHKISIFDSQKLKIFYEGEMKTALTKDNPICPLVLQKVHNSLLNEMRSLIENDPTSNECFKHLEIVFRQISLTNVELLECMQSKVRGIIATYKCKYETEINEFIKEPVSGNISNFLEKHESLKEKLKSEIVVQLKKEMPVNLPFLIHVKTLESYLEKSKTFFQAKLSKTQSKSKPKSKQGLAFNKSIKPATTTNEENPVVLRRNYNHHTAERAKSLGEATIVQNQKGVPETNLFVDKGMLKQENDDEQSRNLHRRSMPAEQNTIALPGKIYALLLHICASKVGLAVVEETPDYIEPNWLHETLYVPANLAVTENNECFYGNDVTDKEKLEPNLTLKYRWNIGRLLTSTESDKWRNENTCTKYENSTSPLLPLALFLSAIKNKAEAERGICIRRLLVSIPRWIPCRSREIIFEAANLSGFESNECHLLNDASSSAFHIFMTNQFEATCNAVVISENASRIDRSVYLFDESLKTLSLCYHSSNEFRKINEQAYVLSGTYTDSDTSTSTQSSSYIPIKNFLEIPLIIKQVCNDVYKVHDKSRAFLLFDSENAGKLIADSISGLTKIYDEATINGMSNILSTFIKKNKPSIDYFLSETITTPIELMHNNIQVFTTKDLIWKYNEVQSIEVPYTHNRNTLESLDFYQIMPNYKCFLGSVIILENPSLPSTLKKIKLDFLCKHGGIFNLTGISYLNEKNSEKYIFSGRYNWKTTNISEEQKFKEKNTFLAIRKQNLIQNELNIYIKKILLLGEELLNDMEKGKGDFKTLIGRALAQKNVKESIESMKSLELDKNGLKEHHDLLISIKVKYEL